LFGSFARLSSVASPGPFSVLRRFLSRRGWPSFLPSTSPGRSYLGCGCNRFGAIAPSDCWELWLPIDAWGSSLALAGPRFTCFRLGCSARLASLVWPDATTAQRTRRSTLSSLVDLQRSKMAEWELLARDSICCLVDEHKPLRLEPEKTAGTQGLVRTAVLSFYHLRTIVHRSIGSCSSALGADAYAASLSRASDRCDRV
jgi:hypothetical protein